MLGKQALELYKTVGNMSEQIYALSVLTCLYISTGDTLAAVNAAKECGVLQSECRGAHSLAAAECLLGIAQVRCKIMAHNLCHCHKWVLKGLPVSIDEITIEGHKTT